MVPGRDLGSVDIQDLERGLRENGSVSGAKSQEEPISFKILRRQNGPFYQILWTRRILPLNALKMLVIRWVSLALFACSATKSVSRHAQTLNVNRP
jgi:hypothetical protein